MGILPPSPSYFDCVNIHSSGVGAHVHVLMTTGRFIMCINPRMRINTSIALPSTPWPTLFLLPIVVHNNYVEGGGDDDAVANHLIRAAGCC